MKFAESDKKTICESCAKKCHGCSPEKTTPNFIENIIHKALKTTPLGCDGESWRCFLKSKHMFLYSASAAVFFIIGNTSNVIFEKTIQDWFFPEKTFDPYDPPKTAVNPQTREIFKIKAVVRDVDTGEKTAILEAIPADTPRVQKITSQALMTKRITTAPVKTL